MSPSVARVRGARCSTTAPVKSATNADAGEAASSAGGALLDHAAAVDDADAVAEQRRLGEVVGHEQRRHAGLGQHGGELAAAGGAGAGVERGQRLVEQQRRRPPRERAGDGDALALAAGQRARPLVGEVRDAEALEQLERPRAGARARSSPRSG